MTDDEIYETIFKIFEDWSVNQGGKRVVGRVYAVLWLEGEPMEINEIQNASGYSLTTIRSTLNILETFQVVRRIKRAHEKKLFYECSKDMTQNVQNSMQQTLNQNLRVSLELIRGLKVDLESITNEKVKRNIQEIESEFERLTEYTESLLEVELPEKKG